MLVTIVLLDSVITGTGTGWGFGEACKCHWYTVAGQPHISDVWNKIEAERHSIKAEDGLHIALEWSERTVAI